MSQTPRGGGRSWPLLLAYPLFALLGALTARPALALLGLALLATGLCLPALRRGRALAWLGWGGVVAVLAWLALRGLAAVALGALPIVVNLLLAGLFGATLVPGRQPLVARFVEAVEGPARLGEPGVARYTRRVTAFWALLLAAQALLLGLMAACTLPGLSVCPIGQAGRWAAVYLHFGSYVLIAVAFLAEYLFRRWRLRHLAHLSLHQFVHRLVRVWPQLVQGRSR